MNKKTRIVLSMVIGSMAVFAHTSAADTSVTDTSVYWLGKVANADFNAKESERLYKALAIPEKITRSGTYKTYKTTDGIIGIGCWNSTVPRTDAYSCRLMVKTDKKSLETTVYREDRLLRASVNDPKNAETFYTLLNLEAQQGRSGFIKIFVPADRKVEIYAFKNTMGFGIPYSFTVSIEIPKQ